MKSLDKKIEEKIAEIRKTADEYPGAVVIHNIQEHTILFMSERGLAGLDQPWEKIRNIGFDEYFRRYFNPEDAKEYFPKIQEMLISPHPHEMVSFFQQVRTAEGGEWEWYLTSMRVLMNDDQGKPLLTISFAIPIDPKNHVTNKVNRLLEENTFLRNHLEKYSCLGKREKEVLTLVASGRSNTEISQELFISELTVKTHRKNIYKKLGINTAFDLQQYARAFDLI